MPAQSDKFHQLAALYEAMIADVCRAQGVQDQDLSNYLASDEYHNLKQAAHLVYEHVRPLAGTFLAIVRGDDSGSALGHPGIETALCFPARFLKSPSTAKLTAESRAVADDLIGNTFFLGLISHLINFEVPSRTKNERVNVRSIAGKWLPEALVADQIMGDVYRGGVRFRVPLLLFETYWKSRVEPALKKQLRLGLFGVGTARSFFKNLYCAGALLVLIYDRLSEEA
ncbi:MAG: hypothetical protein HY691_08845 [Chloroflexi bacterium]|nr:hypothetical protein [Chloroflexota bacterium]